MRSKTTKAEPKRKRVIESVKKSTIELSNHLEEIIDSRTFPKSVFAYNPLEYARGAFFSYLDSHLNVPLETLYLGMNPGPNGMMQTGIPFGDIKLVKEFLGIDSGVQKPKKEHPKKPILGFAWPRSEVSGTRLWSFFQDQYSNADKFFKKNFVLNYCPLGFLSESGANLTPDKLPADLRKKIEAYCDDYLLQVVPLLEAKTLIGVGGYASKIFARLFPGTQVATILHPSPANPAANRGWAGVASQQLREAGIGLPKDH